MDLFRKAYSFAVNAHYGQHREFTKEAYIKHLEETSQLLNKFTEENATIDEYIAALLHDVVEKTDIDILEVGRNFGKEVMSLVSELTNNLYQTTSDDYIKYLVNKINTISDRALNVKLCSILSNVYCMYTNDMPSEFIVKCFDEINYIIKNMNRHLTSTHNNIINNITKTLLLIKLKING